jgi:hypothetical protein
LDLALEEARVTRQPAAAARIQQLHRDLEVAKEHLLRAQQRQAHHADKHRREVRFEVGDEVLLSTTHLKLTGSGDRTAKFTYKYIGPFKIKRVVNNNAYELDLPPQLQIHPVLNVSRLKAYHDGRVAFPLRARVDKRPPPATTSSDGDEYEVESILAKRGTGARVEYLVKWKDWPTWEATWERQQQLTAAKEAVSNFEATLKHSLRNEAAAQVNVLRLGGQESGTVASTKAGTGTNTPPALSGTRIAHTSRHEFDTHPRHHCRISQADTPRTPVRVSGIGDSVIRARVDSRQVYGSNKEQPGTQHKHGNNTGGSRTHVPTMKTLLKTNSQKHLTPSEVMTPLLSMPR